MKNYLSVVTSSEEIEKLHRRLCKHLQTVFADPEIRMIGFTQGRREIEVRFSSACGAGEINAWASRKDVFKDLRIHSFLEGRQGHDELVRTVSMINFPGSSYRRHPAGVFLTDQSGKAFIAHRGRLTKGQQGLKVSEVLTRYAEKAGHKRVLQADDDGQERSFILIGAIDDPKIEIQIRNFSRITREIAEELFSPR